MTKRWKYLAQILLIVSIFSLNTWVFAFPKIIVRAQSETQKIIRYRWSDDGQMLAIGTVPEIRLYHVGSPHPLTIPVPEAKSLAFRQDNRVLASAGADGIVKVWDTATGELIGTWGYPNVGYVAGFYFMPDDVLAINFFDEQSLTTSSPLGSGIWFWSYRTQDEPRVIRTNEYPAEYQLAFNSDASFIVTIRYFSGNDGQAGVYSPMVRDSVNGDSVHFLSGSQFPIWQIIFDPTNSGLIVTVDDMGIVSFLDFMTGHQRFTLDLPRNVVNAAAFSPDGKQLATGGTDREVRLWDTTDGALLASYPDQPADIQKLTFNDKGEMLAFGYPNESATVWDARTLAVLTEFIITDE